LSISWVFYDSNKDAQKKIAPGLLQKLFKSTKKAPGISPGACWYIPGIFLVDWDWDLYLIVR